MERCFIARQFYIKDEYNRSWTPEEAIFTTYDAAYEYIKSFSDSDENPRYQSEIVSLQVDSFTAYENMEVWYFDHAGILLFHKKPHWRREQEAAYTKEFTVGDLVFIKAFPYNTFSYRWLDIIGVVVETPDNLTKYNLESDDSDDDDDDDVEYVIYFISSDGYLDHIHTIEAGMISIDQSDEHISMELRNKLQLVSDHVTGKNVMDDDLFAKIVGQKIKF